MLKIIEQYDPELWQAIDQEKKRQERHIELIASEKLCERAGDASPRVASYQQVCRGLPG